jgi:hypothetical protein
MNDAAIVALQQEPALAWKLAVNILGRSETSSEAARARGQVRQSPLARALISTCACDRSAYKKWDGAHWVLSLLADLGYPPGDETLRPLMEKTLNTWVGAARNKDHARVLDGRVRRCASQEGYAVWSSLRLGFADARTDTLVQSLLRWQWPDGGWNCDKHPEADTSSFMETLIPLRALSLYSRLKGDAVVAEASARAAEVFLCRHLYRRRRDGQVMDPHFIKLHYPLYWHYDILFALKVMAEAGFIGDPRCAPALDLLESKRLSDGGFPAEASYARPSRPQLSGYSPVRWGGISRRTLNPFVTADALYVLRMAGRS